METDYDAEVERNEAMLEEEINSHRKTSSDAWWYILLSILGLAAIGSLFIH